MAQKSNVGQVIAAGFDRVWKDLHPDLTHIERVPERYQDVRQHPAFQLGKLAQALLRERQKLQASAEMLKKKLAKADNSDRFTIELLNSITDDHPLTDVITEIELMQTR